jgi:hypothetical protein
LRPIKGARQGQPCHGGLDIQALAKRASFLRYVDDNYDDPATYVRLRQELGEARRPLHYLPFVLVLRPD